MIKRLVKLAGLFFLPFWVNGQQLTVQIEQDVQFSEFLQPISEAGTDYSASPQAQASVHVSVIMADELNRGNNKNQKWRVFVHKLDMEWNSVLLLEGRRTGSGMGLNNPGNPNIRDGENFQPVTNNPVYFFRGMGEIVQIPLALKLSGFSVTMGARDFETSLVFTVYDDW